jgi:sugar phosphate isomerase/epimerase
MKIDRRNFISKAGMVAAGAMVLPSWACKNSKPDAAAENAEVPAIMAGSIPAFGLQLYTLRDDMPKDPKGVLKQVADFGYKQIESFEGKQGMFWGMSNTDFKAYCDELGIAMVASHCDINKDFEKKAAEAAAIGMKYLICPWVGPQKKLDDFKKIADTFNQKGEVCRQNGIRFAYHNHDYTFLTQEGQIPQDVLMANTNPDLVDFEMDIYWVVTPGADPIAWMKKYPGRFKLSHVKDRIKNAAAGDKDASCELGTGSINYASLLKSASENGMEYFIVEQERYDNSTPLKSAEACAAYLKNLVFS